MSEQKGGSDQNQKGRSRQQSDISPDEMSQRTEGQGPEGPRPPGNAQQGNRSKRGDP